MTSGLWSAVSDSSVARASRLHQAARFAFPQRYAIAFIVALMLAAAAMNAIEPLIVKSVFDALAAPHAAFRLLVIALAVLAAIAILREIMDATANWLTWRTRIGLQYALLEATVGKLHKMPLEIQRSEGVGAIMTRLDRSIQGFTGAVSTILFNILPSAIFLCIAIGVMFRLDWRLAIVVMVFTPVPVLIAMKAAPEQTRRERALLDRWAHIYSRFNEVLSGILTVRSFAMEDAEKARFLGDVAAANQVVINGVATDVGYGAASNLTIAVARLWALGLGVYFVETGQITIGTVVAFLGYIGGLFGPVKGLSEVYATLRRAAVSIDELFGILNVQEHLGDSPDAAEISRIKGDVVFEDVHFSYRQAGRPLLRGISLHVAAGQRLAIVGPSGSGKTTLMAMLMRFYDPQSGQIMLDGRSLKTIKQSSLRRNIGVVLQDPLLFNDTISANIAYGRPNASEEEIQDAARAAHADKFITALHDGYATSVGERGALLSVGERQRIAIARALLKDPPILVLDEATSALDADSEEAVQLALNRLQRGRTTFVIAHRLATVVSADCIIVLRDGRIVEQGTHGQLMRLRGHYAGMVERQTRGLTFDDPESWIGAGPQSVAAPPRRSSMPR